MVFGLDRARYFFGSSGEAPGIAQTPRHRARVGSPSAGRLPCHIRIAALSPVRRKLVVGHAFRILIYPRGLTALWMRPMPLGRFCEAFPVAAQRSYALSSRSDTRGDSAPSSEKPKRRPIMSAPSTDASNCSSARRSSS